jgi:serine-type D-Ala-D-Ala carboxypeptidase (penicillin-binding protein 5/6)
MERRFPADSLPSRSSPRLVARDRCRWQNTNPLIGKYAGAIGIKTGDTRAAGNCLLFEATRGRLTLIGVTLGTLGDDISDTGPVATKVLNWGFKYF